MVTMTYLCIHSRTGNELAITEIAKLNSIHNLPHSHIHWCIGIFQSSCRQFHTSKMNAEKTTNMSPNTYRRLLAAHGRSTTLGVFDCSSQIDPNKILKKLQEVKQGEQEKKHNEVGDSEKIKKKTDSDHIVAQYLVETSKPPNDAVINPPLSKAHGFKPHPVASSYSFYQRPFKVNGKDAWEFAMRDLGSIDTLLNRYGYVQPQLRGKLHNNVGLSRH
ncbi:hypothetical protein Btru_048645 [Bulinus truncatus]|nr:hypothetical protein Btru_048645 [Bulinus truncatus]